MGFSTRLCVRRLVIIEAVGKPARGGGAGGGEDGRPGQLRRLYSPRLMERNWPSPCQVGSPNVHQSEWFMTELSAIRRLPGLPGGRKRKRDQNKPYSRQKALGTGGSWEGIISVGAEWRERCSWWKHGQSASSCDFIGSLAPRTSVYVSRGFALTRQPGDNRAIQTSQKRFGGCERSEDDLITQRGDLIYKCQQFTSL